MLQAVKVGDKVTFHANTLNRQITVIQIEKSK